MQELQSHSLPESERKSIRDEEFSSEDIDDFVSDLQGNQMNSEMKKAWVSKVTPRNNNTEVEIELLLPSGLVGTESDSDTFTRKFEIPQNRFPDHLPFKQFIEELGCYDVGNLSAIIGEEVDIVYNDELGEWEIDGSVFQVDYSEELNEESSQTENTTDNQTSVYVRVGFFVVMGLASFLFFLRFLGVVGLVIGLLISVSMFMLALNELNS